MAQLELPIFREDQAGLYIYALCDPRTGEVRYVGCSSKPYQRYGSHLARHGWNTPKIEWVAELRALHLHPRLWILDGPIPYQGEAEWAIFFADRGHRLLNAPCTLSDKLDWILAGRGTGADYEAREAAQTAELRAMLSARDLAAFGKIRDNLRRGHEQQG